MNYFLTYQLFKRNEKGETLLHVAAIAGNLAAARQLISEVSVLVMTIRVEITLHAHADCSIIL